MWRCVTSLTISDKSVPPHPSPSLLTSTAPADNLSWINCSIDSSANVFCDLCTGELPQLVQTGEPSVQHGIPAEAFDLECPDGEFKAAVLQEFILLDGKYVERLDRLDDEHYTAIRLVFFSGSIIFCMRTTNSSVLFA